MPSQPRRMRADRGRAPLGGAGAVPPTPAPPSPLQGAATSTSRGVWHVPCAPHGGRPGDGLPYRNCAISAAACVAVWALERHHPDRMTPTRPRATTISANVSVSPALPAPRIPRGRHGPGRVVVRAVERRVLAADLDRGLLAVQPPDRR